MADAIVVEVERGLEDLIPLFLEQRRNDLTVISRALEADDFETLRRVGHGMAGAGRSYGFNAISEMGEAMELAARAHNGAELAKIRYLLMDYMERVHIDYV